MPSNVARLLEPGLPVQTTSYPELLEVMAARPNRLLPERQVQVVLPNRPEPELQVAPVVARLALAAVSLAEEREPQLPEPVELRFL